MDLKISKLKVENFRNLSPDIIDFSENINCIIGPNGNGKTNILEAIYYLANRKSFRKNTSFPQLVSIDGEKPEITFQSLFVDGDDKVSLSGTLNQSSSKWFKDGKPIKRKIGIDIVFINPFESYGFHSVPSDRRSWFDKYISNISAEYKKALSKYTQSLRQRNFLLSKKPNKFKEQLKAIDTQIAPLVVEICAMRENFLSEITPLLKENYKKIFSEECELTIHLDQSLKFQTAENVFLALQNNLERECILCHTEKGPHRDDYVLLYNGINSYDYCSLGQQKMSYLSLLFAYIDLFRYKFKAYPIVLIDDVSGELDRFRWQKLIAYLDKCEFQVLITTANEKFKEELEKIESAKQIYISKGSVLLN